MGWQRYICLTWLVLLLSFCLLPVDGWTACTPAPSGMVSWWSGDNNALDLIGTNEGTLVNGATYAAGIVGQSFSFDGVDDSVSLPNVALWDFGTNSFSIDAWFKTSTPGLGNIIRYDTGTAGSGFWGIRLTASGHLEFLIADSSRTVVSITTDNPYADGSWHFIAAVRDGENRKLKIYIDGSPAATEVSDEGANIIGAADAFPSLGAGSWGGEFFSGLVDEVEIFNRSLSVQEIAAIYTAGSVGKCRPCAPPPSDLVSWWGGDNNALDMVGINNGTLQGDATYAAGKVGQAFSFDGTGDYVSIPDQLSLNPTAAITVDAWIKPLSTNHVGILNKGAIGSKGAYELAIYLNKFYFQLNDAGLNMPSLADIPSNTWTHVAATYDGSTAKIYINGVPDNATSYISTINSNSHPLHLGLYGSPNVYFDGQLDEMTLYHRALSSQEIAAIYNAGATGKCSPKALTVSPSGTGSGSVIGNGLNCSWNGSSSSGTCSVTLNRTTAVSLTAGPSVGSTFSGWSGGSGSAAGCSGPGPCSFSITQDSGVGAPFTLGTYTLTVSPSGTGSGSVTGNGIVCAWDDGSTSSGTCSVSLAYDTAVSLNATPSTGSSFNGWSGGTGSAVGCSGTGSCSFTITQGSAVGAPFTLNTYTVTATAQGNGAGTVGSNTGGVSYSYPAVNAGTTSALNHGTIVGLKATASTGSTGAWTTCSGTASGNGTPLATCSYASLDGNKTTAATFTLNTFSLTVTPSGTGSGSVTGNGIECAWDGNDGSGTCGLHLDYNTAVSLTAAPSAGSAFSGWSGGSGSASGCSGTGACAFNLTEVSGIGSIFTRKGLIYLPLILHP